MPTQSWPPCAQSRRAKVYKIRRIHLESVGHRAARFDPLTLDLTDGERPIDVVMWLRNGGGKTSILSLIFALLFPEVRHFLGRSQNKRIEDYVQHDDVAHTVIEWERESEGIPGLAEPDRLVTGVVRWWPRQRSGESSQLERRFYAFRSIPGYATFDELVFRDSRGRIRGADFVQGLRSRQDSHPSIELYDTENITAWTSKLDALHLHPKLFDYQRKMNSDEGGATEFLDFDSGDKFVDLVLDIVIEPETAERIVTNLGQVREKLELLPVRERERDFIRRILQWVEPLRSARQNLAAARAKREAVLGQGHHLARRLSLNVSRLESTFEELGRQALTHEERVRQLSSQEGGLERRLNRAAIVLASLRLADAKAATKAAEAELEVRRLDLRGWTAAQHRMAERVYTARAQALADVLRERETADGLGESYRRAATLYRRRLEADAAAVAEHAQTAQREAGAEDDRREEASEQEREQNTRLTACRLRLAEIGGMLDELATTRRALVEDEVIARGEAGSDALARLETEDTELAAGESAIAVRRPVLAGDRKQVLEEIARLDGEHARKEAARNRVLDERQGFCDRADAIAREPRIGEIAEHDEVDIWTAHRVLVETLGRLAAAAGRDIAAAELARLSGQRALTWLEDQSYGLLPPSPDVEQAVEVLRARDLPAVPGWHHLAVAVRPDLRETVIERAPQLVLGLVVPSDRVSEARRILTEEGVDAEAVVVITDAAAIQRTAEREDGGPAWEVHLSRPALYDRTSVPAEVEARQNAAVTVQEQLSAAEAQRSHDQALEARVRLLIENCPPRRLEEMEAEVAGLTGSLEALAQEHGAAERQLAAREREASELDEALGLLGRRRRTVAVELPRVRRLQELEARSAELAAEKSIREAERAKLVAGIEASRTEQTEAREQAAAKRDEARRHDLRAASLRERLRGLPEFQLMEDPDLDASLEELEERFRGLEESYRQRVTESSVAREHEQASRSLGNARKDLLRFSEQIRNRTDELLAANPGIDEVERGSLQADAAIEVSRAETAWEQANTEAESSRKKLKEYESVDPKRLAELESEPQTTVEAEALEVRMREQLADVRSDLNAAVAERDTIQTKRRQLDHDRQLLAANLQLVEALQVRLEAELAVELAFEPLGPNQAAGLVEELKGALGQAREEERSADAHYAEVAEQVRRFVVQPDFGEVSTKLVVTLRTQDKEGVATMLLETESELGARLVVLENEIAEIDGHKTNLVKALAQETLKALGHLRAIANYRIPRGLGDWSGESFIRIRIETPELGDLEPRLRGLIEDALATKRGRQQIQGLDLLKTAVRTANRGRPFEVSMLKPNTDLVVERAPASDVKRWSGGERLTAAILIYCVLLWLRTRERGRQWDVLILDNPFGKANHVTLVDLQRRVAEVLGIQLIYFTGINDESALTVFGGIVRPFNNLVDARSGRRFVVPEGTAPARIYRRSSSVV
jgi:hypothetical protein